MANRPCGKCERDLVTCGLLPTRWQAVPDRQIDGEGSETAELELKASRFGGIQAAKRFRA